MDSVSMPHNSNGSNGQMFEMETFKGGAINRAYAEKRMRNEPVVEITQVKGTSDTHPLLSPDDEWADFEIMDKRVGSRPPTYSKPSGSYVRDAYLRGLTLAEKGLTNPYKFGLIGSSDSHVGGPSDSEELFFSKIGLLDGTAELRGMDECMAGGCDRVDDTSDSGGALWKNWQIAASGYAAVWARENTREEIFDAFKRKETYSTTGPRIAVRFFGGWDFDIQDSLNPNFVSEAYEKGVTMGSDLMNSGDKTPEFILWAQRDIKVHHCKELKLSKDG